MRFASECIVTAAEFTDSLLNAQMSDAESWILRKVQKQKHLSMLAAMMASIGGHRQMENT